MATVSMATYLQRGESLDYTNAGEATIPAGSVISLTTRIGVAGTDIPVGAVGSVHVIGVFSMEKTESQDIKMGDALYFDAETGKITNVGEGKVPAGYAAAPSGTTEKTVLVNIGFPPAAAASAAGKTVTNLSDLEDVDDSGRQAGYILKWNDDESKWKAEADSEAV